MAEAQTLEDRIYDKIDLVKSQEMVVSDALGGVLFRNMAEVMEFAKMLSVAKTGVPPHMRNSPGTCLVITVQALEWRMSPIAVANKSYEVNGRVAYESQLIHAVVLSRAPLVNRPREKFEGEGTDMTCTITAYLKGEEEPFVYTSPPIKDIKVQNSPLWKTDPSQQLFYYSTRAWARRHVPDVLLGIYAVDELPDYKPGDPRGMQDITPKEDGDKPNIASRLRGTVTGGFNIDEVVRQTGGATVVTAADVTASESVAPAVVAEAAAEKSEATEETSLSAEQVAQPDPVVADPTPVIGGERIDAEWLDEQIAKANNCKMSADLETLDPDVYRILKEADRKDLGARWDAEGYEPNKKRLAEEAAKARASRFKKGDL